MIVGCSHPGILNILTTVQKRFDKPIRAVFGGTHLVEADAGRIRATLEQMKQMESALSDLIIAPENCFRRSWIRKPDWNIVIWVRGTAFTCKRRKRNE